jgi:aminomethyltransferase
MQAGLKRTPLYEVHRAAGAKMVDFGGWEMPEKYSTTRLECGQVQYSGLLHERGGFVDDILVQRGGLGYERVAIPNFEQEHRALLSSDRSY